MVNGTTIGGGAVKRGPGHFDRFTFGNNTPDPVDINFSFYDSAMTVVHTAVAVGIAPTTGWIDLNLPKGISVVRFEGDAHVQAQGDPNVHYGPYDLKCEFLIAVDLALEPDPALGQGFERGGQDVAGFERLELHGG